MLPLTTHDQVNLLLVSGLRSWAHDPWQDWLDVRFRDAHWVRPRDGEWPDLGVWARRIEQGIAAQGGDDDCLVIAHGFGALAAAWHAFGGHTRPAGLILLAPADPQRFAITPESLERRLPCEASLVASTHTVPDNHPWLHGEAAQRWAQAFGARFVDAGAGPGAANIPSWPLGQQVLEDHVQRLGRPHRQPALLPMPWETAA
jgi:uncharacterized protein